MKRTYLNLPVDQWKQLNDLSRRQSTPIAELIRRAILQVYPVRRRSGFVQALHDVTGIWKDRQDLGSTESYVRELRQNDRLERLNR